MRLRSAPSGAPLPNVEAHPIVAPHGWEETTDSVLVYSPDLVDSPEVVHRIEEGLPIVEAVARGMRRQFGSHVNLDDLVSQGRETLLQAARSFDPERGVPFKRWAALRVRGGMIDAIRTHGNLPKRVYRKLRALQAMDHVQDAAQEEAPPASPEAADAALTDQLASAAMAAAVGFLAMRDSEFIGHAQDPDHSPESNVGYAEMIALVKSAIAERSEQEQALLRRVYFDDVTIEEAARELGLSKSWGSRLHARAIEGLVRSMKRARV
ncbi:MAG: sigma-70 family RNA polymerase sigma factor [Labilithrix sp.]